MASFWGSVGKFFNRVGKALSNPATFAPPPIEPPTIPTPPPPRKRAAPRKQAPRKRQAPPERPRETRSRYIPRADLPRDWGRNKSALWSDATKRYNDIGYDRDAQALYDAALYDFRGDPEARKAILDNLKDYIADRYGVDWDDIFDWEDYRNNYDATAGRGAYASGGNYPG